MRVEASFNTPVLFLIFNRPETTQIVFNKIREIRPRQLFVAADGPRKNVLDDHGNCLGARKIIDQIDWPCQVKMLFSN